jgi:hypothetical protein
MHEMMAAHLRQVYGGAIGLRELLKLAQSYTEQIPRKLRHMEQTYFERNPSLYSDEERDTVRYYQDAFLYKQFSCDWLTEQMQGMRHTGSGDRRLLEVLENSLDAHDTRDVDAVIWSLLLDNYLVQAATFLDFYLLYIWAFFRQPLSQKILKWKGQIMPMLEAVEEPVFRAKAASVVNYVRDKVFSESLRVETRSIQGWGTVVNGLRHTVVHRDRVSSLPSFGKAETLTEKKTKNWEGALKAIDCAQFCEDVRGDMFQMTTKLAEVLYEQPWVPGPIEDQARRSEYAS